ncbi:hypothetical protein CALVIDRAFT_536722 [Calocera viscosa TUFC12733]|uniref:F-box domain-containing protein n=1 Tax=Calocera viscosa (strain TUFC12733) TaxID=1330018 RepID=A0A167MK57_CALVF|nr:hypothetical protein CALVIDRAFT_536722 [Calocera viscosa TUFC12733]
MPMLERLHVCLPSGKEDTLTPGHLSFPSLRSVIIDCDGPTELSWFMHGLQAPALESIQLQVQDTAFSPQIAIKFSDLVGTKFRHLRAFWLQPWSTDGSDLTWIFQSFQGLLKCHGMECFGVNLPSHIIATDDDIRDIVKVWPALRDLQIGYSQPGTDYPRVTFSGLATLAWELPELSSLRLAVLPALSKERAVSLLRTATSPSLVKDLSFQDLPGDRPSPAFIEGIAHVILHLFPRVKSFTCSRSALPSSKRPAAGHVERDYPLSARDIVSCIAEAYRK